MYRDFFLPQIQIVDKGIHHTGLTTLGREK
jgi:hypothetical protein